MRPARTRTAGERSVDERGIAGDGWTRVARRWRRSESAIWPSSCLRTPRLFFPSSLLVLLPRPLTSKLSGFIAQLGERQTEDLKVPRSIRGEANLFSILMPRCTARARPPTASTIYDLRSHARRRTRRTPPSPSPSQQGARQPHRVQQPQLHPVQRRQRPALPSRRQSHLRASSPVGRPVRNSRSERRRRRGGEGLQRL